MKLSYCKIVLLTCVLLFAACESYDCTLYNYVGMYATFYKDGAAVAINDTLTIISGKSGLVLLNQSAGTSNLNLPLSFWQDVDTLVFSIKHDVEYYRDTVWIKKSNHVHYESPDCPMTLFHDIQEVPCTHVFIKEITVTRPSVNYETTENLQIHLWSASD